MLAKPHAWSNLFGPGQFIGVGLPFLLIMAAGMSSFIASITSASLMLIALAMALATGFDNFSNLDFRTSFHTAISASTCRNQSDYYRRRINILGKWYCRHLDGENYLPE